MDCDRCQKRFKNKQSLKSHRSQICWVFELSAQCVKKSVRLKGVCEIIVLEYVTDDPLSALSVNRFSNNDPD
ncbi:unnamed protein product [Callosobruchus maculatus]|uniref:C2H2-type domain-containing protein n=1 Tax=Callosobruchus maculatus TaxID=64391 RepID=A0A653BS80_CALMS|nr:unnamed protein product [Callosobruchus maculatus]